ncbi:MAG TPA: phosphoribosylaminoimidazolesuccinocarboxamide synthase [Pirellulaceae bacterium]|nr:phosphoribosylaminoimidazolesuccinocarboxamide synthase [Pirellulaceae bacterium]
MTVKSHSGKVRDIYDLGDSLLLVATDRISAFDWILPTLIPDKGRVLTQMSLFWFDLLGVPNHLLSADIDQVSLPDSLNRDSLRGRSMHVRKCQVVPVECVVRGYLVGSGWRDYQRTGEVCGHRLPHGLLNCSRFPEPIFTPATKASSGHDENISFEQMCEIVGESVAHELKERSLAIYTRAAAHAQSRGIILADTKFEFGWDGDQLLLIDEVLTPDSSRYWPADSYQPGRNQLSFDKQYVREYLETTDWDKQSPPPPLPDHVVVETRRKYIEAYERITGQPFVI